MDHDVLEVIVLFFQDGHDPAEIYRRLVQHPKFEGRIPHIRTLQRLIKDMKERSADAPKSITLLDKPFQWHRLAEYGLPWEAGSFLLNMWAFFKEFGVMRPAPPPTARQARWWWRVHLAAPDMSMLDLWYLSQEFASRELVSDVLGKSLELEDLEARLAYKPWADDEKNQTYHRAIEEGRIPEMKKRQPILMESIQAGKQIAWSRESAFIGMAGGLANSLGCPELLHSQALAMLSDEMALLSGESNEEIPSGSTVSP